jgi:hypothetical protein
MQNSSYTVGNRLRDIPVCSAVPQPLRHHGPLIKRTIILFNIFSGSAAQSGLWLPRHTRFLDHIRDATVGRTAFGRVISSSLRTIPDNTQHTQQTNIHASDGIRNHDRSRRAALEGEATRTGIKRNIPNIKSALCITSLVYARVVFLKVLA